jgi:arylsulfatase A-like enzyme
MLIITAVVDQNVIVVVVDALRADRVGAIRDQSDLTPNIDRLVQDGGVVFKNAFACINATDPSITSIHSGYEPSSTVAHHGPYVTNEEKQRAEAMTSVPEQLQAAGVHTIGTGRPLSRWHKAGFDQYPEPTFGRNRRRAIGERLDTLHPKLRSVAGWLYEHLSAATTTETTDEIDSLLASLNEERQFYGFVHLMDTHAPYEPCEQLVDELLERREYPRDDLAEFFETHDENDHVREFIKEHATTADYEYGVGRLIAKYDATVIEADQKIGRLIDELRQRGRYEETTLIVTSDHGESLDEHGIFFDHHGLYDESIHVPLIISGPETQSARREEFVQLYDLAPTILRLFGLTADDKIAGKALQSLITDEGSWTDREQIVAREAHTQSRIAIRTPEWKYIKHIEDSVLERERGDSLHCGYCNCFHGSEMELYDIDEDPAERENIIEEFPNIVAELEAKIEAYEQSLNRPTTDTETHVAYDNESEVMERLEDLGYR